MANFDWFAAQVEEEIRSERKTIPGRVIIGFAGLIPFALVNKFHECHNARRTNRSLSFDIDSALLQCNGRPR